MQHPSVNRCSASVVSLTRYAAITVLAPATAPCVNPETALALPARFGNKLTAAANAMGTIRAVVKNAATPGRTTNGIDSGRMVLAITAPSAAVPPNERPMTIDDYIGPFTTLLVGRSVDFELDLDLHTFELDAKGHIDDFIAPKKAGV